MFPAPSVHLESDAAVATQIATALQDWNERQVGPRNTRHFTLTVRGANGELLAGLSAEMFWSVLYIVNLWVNEDHWRMGYGTALLRQAETIAQSRPCYVAFLSTMTFQAPGFYEKCGYSKFGELPYASEPFGRIWYAKRLES